ncbi:MAG: hypothetical protein FWH41_08220 [Treponema sp.]|nr:hypothetical protein [Treponema sp.]
MKKFCAVICSATLLALSCVTSVISGTFPRDYSFDGSKEFIILGEIIYESAFSSGYIDLLKEARKIYPSCDYIIDIMRDERITVASTYSLGGTTNNTKTTWVTRGMAIQFINTEADSQINAEHIPSVTINAIAVENWQSPQTGQRY